MGKYLLSKDLDEFLCGEFVNRDQARCGFLTKDDIKAAVKRVGIPISEKQVTELTQVVSVDSKNRYNYLELIAYLLGVRYMQRL
jgi:Ca2+-binding EF-hand superfamily protein